MACVSMFPPPLHPHCPLYEASCHAHANGFECVVSHACERKRVVGGREQRPVCWMSPAHAAPRHATQPCHAAGKEEGVERKSCPCQGRTEESVGGGGRRRWGVVSPSSPPKEEARQRQKERQVFCWEGVWQKFRICQENKVLSSQFSSSPSTLPIPSSVSAWEHAFLKS